MPTWHDKIAANPNHSENYAQRWRRFAAEGKDIVGEGRFIDAMVPRGSRILDAGCGTGRIGGYLHNVGHTVTGVDLDPVLITYARADYPDCEWSVGDLTLKQIPGNNYDCIVMAGNVMGFIAPACRGAVLEGLHDVLAAEGRAVIGFGNGWGYSFSDFFADAKAAGFRVSLTLESWDIRPFTQASSFLVAVLERMPSIRNMSGLLGSPENCGVF